VKVNDRCVLAKVKECGLRVKRSLCVLQKRMREYKLEVYTYKSHPLWTAGFIDDDNSIVMKPFVRSLLTLTHQRRCVTRQENKASARYSRIDLDISQNAELLAGVSHWCDRRTVAPG
jgi:hypothetical protein